MSSALTLPQIKAATNATQVEKRTMSRIKALASKRN
jgi:hypothetical protein